MWHSFQPVFGLPAEGCFSAIDDGGGLATGSRPKVVYDAKG